MPHAVVAVLSSHALCWHLQVIPCSDTCAAQHDMSSLYVLRVSTFAAPVLLCTALSLQRRQHMQRVKEADGPGGSLMSGTVKGFAGIYDIPKALGKGGRGGTGGAAGRAGGSSWRTRAAAEPATGRRMGYSTSSTSSSSPNSRGFTGDTYSSMRSSSTRSIGRSIPAGGMPVVAAAASAAAAPYSSSDALLLPQAVAAAPAAVAAAAAAPAAAAAAGLNSFTLWRDSLPGWRAAARPAAAAAAATAQALESAGLPAPRVRAPKLPELRLAQDFLLLPTQHSLTYLDGSLPGDFGFDPLGLFDPQVTSTSERAWLVTSEVMHGASSC